MKWCGKISLRYIRLLVFYELFCYIHVKAKSNWDFFPVQMGGGGQLIENLKKKQQLRKTVSFGDMRISELTLWCFKLLLYIDRNLLHFTTLCSINLPRAWFGLSLYMWVIWLYIKSAYFSAASQPLLLNI